MYYKMDGTVITGGIYRRIWSDFVVCNVYCYAVIWLAE